MSERVHMICELTDAYREARPGKATVQSLSKEAFRAREDLYAQYVQKLWDNAFHTREIWAAIEAKADWFAVATENGQYLGSALAVVMGHIWYVHYVLTIPERRKQGIGRQVMRHLLWEAKRQNAALAVLDCNPDLVDFYKECGFRPWVP